MSTFVIPGSGGSASGGTAVAGGVSAPMVAPVKAAPSTPTSGALSIREKNFAVFPQAGTILKNRFEVAERESGANGQATAPSAHGVLGPPVNFCHRRQRSDGRRFNGLSPRPASRQSSRAVSNLGSRRSFRGAKSDERHPHALAFQAEDAPRPSLATQRFEACEEGIEPFLPPLEEANDRLLTRLGNAADGEPGLILKALP